MGPLLALALMASVPQLSDDALARAARDVFRTPREQTAIGRKVIGIHHGLDVVADIRCSDVCPTYTKRILHYAIEPGAACAKAGGQTVTEMVPYSIAVVKQDFCIPGVLYRATLYTDPK